MSIYEKLKQCISIDEFYSMLDNIKDDDVFNYLKEELEAVDLYEDILLEIESIKCKKTANEVLNDLFDIRNTLSEYSLLPIVDVSIRAIEGKLDNLKYCDDIIAKRIRILEKNAPKCTKCGQSLIIREGKGVYFWGCRDFPDCWGKRYFKKEENEWIYNGTTMSEGAPSKLKDEGILMDEKTKLEEYKDIIECLSDGVNPLTGEVFGYDHIYQNSKITRALIESVKLLEKEIKRQKRITILPVNAGKRWSKEEDKRLIQKFNEGIEIKELAEIFERSTGSIRSRLLDYGILTQNDKEL